MLIILDNCFVDMTLCCSVTLCTAHMPFEGSHFLLLQILQCNPRPTMRRGLWTQIVRSCVGISEGDPWNCKQSSLGSIHWTWLQNLSKTLFECEARFLQGMKTPCECEAILVHWMFVHWMMCSCFCVKRKCDHFVFYETTADVSMTWILGGCRTIKRGRGRFFDGLVFFARWVGLVQCLSAVSLLFSLLSLLGEREAWSHQRCRIFI